MGLVRRASTALLRSSIRNSTPKHGIMTTSRSKSFRTYSLLSSTPRRPQLPHCSRTMESPLCSITHPIPTACASAQVQNPIVVSIQVRNHRRATYDPSHRVRKRRHGFLARLKSRTGRMVLARRKAKNRSKLSH